MYCHSSGNTDFSPLTYFSKSFYAAKRKTAFKNVSFSLKIFQFKILPLILIIIFYKVFLLFLKWQLKAMLKDFYFLSVLSCSDRVFGRRECLWGKEERKDYSH